MLTSDTITLLDILDCSALGETHGAPTVVDHGDCAPFDVVEIEPATTLAEENLSLPAPMDARSARV